MHALVILLPLLTAQAFTLAQNREWTAAAIALDQAYAKDPASFRANNFHYLRGRMAESQSDWTRALAEFEKVDAANPLRALAAWHEARVSIQAGKLERAGALAGGLPLDFPADMKLQLAREAPQDLALKIYAGLTSREARFQRAVLLGENAALWTLLRESNTDDVALESARILAPLASTARET